MSCSCRTKLSFQDALYMEQVTHAYTLTLHSHYTHTHTHAVFVRMYDLLDQQLFSVTIDK